MLDIIVCTIGWFSIGCQTWAVKYHFNVEKVPPGAKLITVMVITSALLLTYLSVQKPQPMPAAWAGTAVMLAGLVLFWRTIKESSKANLLAVFDEDLPHGLLKTGPYRYVRHPFYTAYMLHWCGWALAAWHVWSVVPAVAMVTTYWVAARDEEQKFSRTEMSKEYRNSRANTGQFFPRLMR